MAQKIEVVITCDRCPDGRSREVTDTLTLGYNGADYETDLCAVHKQEADNTLSVFMQHARRIAGNGRAPGPKRDRKSAEARFRKDARAWAMKTGRPVNAMGRIPMQVLTDYRTYLDSQRA